MRDIKGSRKCEYIRLNDPPSLGENGRKLTKSSWCQGGEYGVLMTEICRVAAIWRSLIIFLLYAYTVSISLISGLHLWVLSSSADYLLLCPGYSPWKGEVEPRKHWMFQISLRILRSPSLFLSLYVNSTKMASVRRSTTEIGTAFEKHSQRYLNHHLHMSLRRVGGAGDGGVDLRGSWYVPPDTLGAGPSRRRASSTSLDSPVGGGEASGREAWRRLRVVAQCKAEKKGLGPRAVRELEGVVAHLEGE